MTTDLVLFFPFPGNTSILGQIKVKEPFDYIDTELHPIYLQSGLFSNGRELIWTSPSALSIHQRRIKDESN